MTRKEEYFDHVAWWIREYPQQRVGQSMFNVFRICQPEVLEGMTTDHPADCFYDDNKILAFLQYIDEYL